MRRPAGGQMARVPKAPHFRKLRRQDPRTPVNVTLKLRGGPECWIEVHARGCVGRYPGYVSVYELLEEICNAGGHE